MPTSVFVVILDGDENEIKLHRWAFVFFFFFVFLFQWGKRFCLCEQSFFGQNIHRLDTWDTCRMASYGRIEFFFPAQCDWITYVERLSYYFKANSITDANIKRAVLLSVCGTETFSILKDHVTPDSIRNKTFDKLLHALEEHCNPAPTVIVERFNFYMYQQQPNQTITDFIAQLEKQSQYPGYDKGLAGCRCSGRPYLQMFISRKKLNFA